MTPHNVLLVTIDQWRADSLGCVGHPAAVTPNIDRLASRGVRFDRHYTQAAPCGPSRASLLTGTYLHQHRSVGNGTPLPARLTNLVLELRSAGYDPTLFGYTDTTVDPRTVEVGSPWLSTYEGVLPGFTVNVRLPESAEPWLQWLRTRGYEFDDVWDAYRQVDPGDAATGRGTSWAPVRYSAEHTEAAFLVERFGEWHTSLDREPWCAHVTFLRPHPPYVAPAPYNDLIDPNVVDLPIRHATIEEEGAQHPMVAGAMFVEQVRAPADETEMRQLIATYLGNLAEVDSQLGRLLDGLDAAGALSDTVVILTSDHGDQMGDHWLLEKLGYFEASYHVPLIVAGPAVEKQRVGSTVDEFTEHVDVMPTILDSVGVDVPRQCAGRSLRPFLTGDGTATEWRDAAHWEWDFRDAQAAASLGLDLASCNLAVLRDRTRKYVHFAGLPAAFYDLEMDPNELHNLAGDPTRTDEILGYAQRMLSWRLSSDDQTLANHRATADGMIELDR